MNPVTRRNFLTTLASLYGVRILTPLQAQSLHAGRAKRVIHLWMAGGMSHIDSFAPSKDYNNKIPTNVDGIEISGNFPKIATRMDDICLIRSLSITQGAHEEASYLSLTSYAKRGTITHPTLGSWINKLGGVNNKNVPGNVQIGGGLTGSGWMEPVFAPLIINSPNDGIKNSISNLSSGEFQDRIDLKNEFDSQFPATNKSVKALDDQYRNALKLMTSEDLKAFSLNEEDNKTKEFYGNNSFGLGCLLARRLVEYDVKYVQVNLGGFDLHTNIDVGMQRQGAMVDQALNALIIDLKNRGLFDETLIVLNTEFGRTPKINDDDGRDHHPQAYCALMCGGGIIGGQVYGKMDEQSNNVIENKCTPNDLNATIASAMGIDISSVLYSPTKRPFTIADKGRALPLFS